MANKPEELDEFGEPITPAVTQPATRGPRVARQARPTQLDKENKPVINVPEANTKEVVRFVNMDNRKLSKKQKQQVTDKWNGDNKGRVVDALFKAQAEIARKIHGHSAIMVGDVDENVVVGIPCPFVFEYITLQSVFPLGLIYHLVGPPGSCKSALLYEMMRWVREAGGGSVLQEVESKFSPELMQSVVNFADDEVNVIVNKCHSLEDWQRKLLYWIKFEKAAMDGTKEEPGPGRNFPVLFGVDSIMGKASEETQEKVLDAGSAGRNFPMEALSITTYMRTLPQLLDGFPFAIVLNNHLKMGKDQQGIDLRNIAGGQGVKFQESFEIETKVRQSKISCKDWDGAVINLKCFKNSFGSGHRNFDARMLWWSEETAPGSGKYKQVTKWDWHWSTVKMLISCKDRDASELKKHGFHISAPATAMVENLAWSATLGMKAKDAVPWAELGKMLVESPEALKIMRDALGIKRRPLLRGDYSQQLNTILSKKGDAK